MQLVCQNGSSTRSHFVSHVLCVLQHSTWLLYRDVSRFALADAKASQLKDANRNNTKVAASQDDSSQQLILLWLRQLLQSWRSQPNCKENNRKEDGKTKR